MDSTGHVISPPISPSNKIGPGRWPEPKWKPGNVGFMRGVPKPPSMAPAFLSLSSNLSSPKSAPTSPQRDTISLQKRIVELEATLAVSRKRDKEISELQEQLSHHQVDKERIRQLLQENSDLRTSLANKEQESESLNKELCEMKKATTDSSAKSGELSAVLERCKQLTATNNDLDVALREKDKEFEAAATEVRQLKEALHNQHELQISNSLHNTELKKAIDISKLELCKEQDHCKNLEAQVTSLQHAQSQALKEQQELQEKIDKIIVDSRDELTASNQAICKLEHMLTNVEDGVLVLTAGLDVLK